MLSIFIKTYQNTSNINLVLGLVLKIGIKKTTYIITKTLLPII
jgi:hypothetical protein